MATKPGFLNRLFTGVWTLVDKSRRTLVNLVFLLLVYLIINSLFFTETPKVQSGSILVLKPAGYLVDELDYIDPLDELIEELSDSKDKVAQTLLRDLLKAIDTARQDPKITALYLNLGNLYGAAPSKLQDIALAVQNFKTSGKPVYAYSEFYNQAQYYIASQADEIYLDPIGAIYIQGYGQFNTYFKDALDKLGINYHIFKAGNYKTAIEPYIRNDMSDDAKEANLGYLNDLWQSYTRDVAEARGLTESDINRYSNDFLDNLSQAKYNTASMAIDKSLVDALKTRQEMNSYLTEKLGDSSSDDDFPQISHKKYLKIIQNTSSLGESSKDKVAVVVAKGVIYNGHQKAGNIGGQSTAKLIRKARLDKSVKALVIRVDSPGGSAYASEIIRREVLKTRDAGKPVVISMGSYAASGGYWISASADEIWASPTTITGSIGVYGMLPTFEKPLNQLGIHRDGVGTTRLTGAFDLGRPLREDVGKAMQSSIEYSYDRFLTIVAEGRKMTKEAVSKVAQGRVWSGKAAVENGLVDHLGDINDAIDSAATMAGLVSYKTKYIEHKLSDSEKFIKNLMTASVVSSLVSTSPAIYSNQNMMLSPTVLLMRQLQASYQALVLMNDPQNIYAHCLCTLD
ncbi:MAG: signal peptide peptidase SppA [Gammaproteobacteria bacterium]|nr:MAG: signal peptide peptidase SppA [Gammaproteobacteria bacterium]